VALDERAGRDASGELVEWFGMDIDITEQKQAEAAPSVEKRAVGPSA
jgi:hypothetical protein